MLIKKSADIPASEITPAHLLEQRREFARRIGRIALAGMAGAALPVAAQLSGGSGAKIAGVKPSPLSTTEKPTSLKDVTTYNNFYEFGTDKDEPAQRANTLKTRPWTIAVEGAVKKPRIYGIEDLMKLGAMQERIYRMR